MCIKRRSMTARRVFVGMISSRHEPGGERGESGNEAHQTRLLCTEVRIGSAEARRSEGGGYIKREINHEAIE